MFKKKITGFAFFRIGRSFFGLFFCFKKKNAGLGLILGSVGLRQYNNFFFGLSLATYWLPFCKCLYKPYWLVYEVSGCQSFIFQRNGDGGVWCW